MQERSQYQEGLYFLLLWGRFSDINQDGYTTLHDTSSLVKVGSLLNPKLFWQVCCWCARAGYLFVLWVLNFELFYQSSRALRKALIFRVKAKSVHSVGVLCLPIPNPREGSSFHRFQGFRACQKFVLSVAGRRYAPQQPSFFFQEAKK